jgi:hypothetical protein
VAVHARILKRGKCVGGGGRRAIAVASAMVSCAPHESLWPRFQSARAPSHRPRLLGIRKPFFAPRKLGLLGDRHEEDKVLRRRPRREAALRRVAVEGSIATEKLCKRPPKSDRDY